MIGPLVRRDVFPTARPLYATCDAGLEELLAAELRALGVADVHPGHRGVGFMGDREVLWRANLCLRVANRVLVPLAEFPAADRDALYAGAAAVEWSDWFESKRSIVMDASCHASAIDHTAFASLVVKDAVCDHFRELEGRRPSVDKKRADVPINVRIDHDHCVLSLDSSGSRLYRRGYRTEAGPAPLKETLAAAILLMSGWTPELPLVDPMCGAGTFVLEAGMMARNIPPGLHRLGKRGEGFAFQNWSTHRAAAFDRVVRALRDDIEDCLLQPIEGGDLDDKALELARRNAKRCGLADDVTLFRRALGEATPPADAPAGVVVVNPPYGKRLRPGDLDGLYKSLGYTLKRRFAGWTAHVLVGNEAPAHRIGLRPSDKTSLRNGPIDCTLLTYDLFEGRGPVDEGAWDKHEGERPARPRYEDRDARDARDARPRRDDRDDRPRGGPPRTDRPRRDDRDDRPRSGPPRRDDRDERPRSGPPRSDRPRRDDRDERPRGGPPHGDRPRRDDRDERPRAERPRPPVGRTPGDKPPPRGRPANVDPPRRHRPKREGPRDEDRDD